MASLLSHGSFDQFAHNLNIIFKHNNIPTINIPEEFKNKNLKIFIYYLFIIQIPKIRHRGVGAHQCQGNREEGKTSAEENEEKERIEAQRVNPQRRPGELRRS